MSLDIEIRLITDLDQRFLYPITRPFRGPILAITKKRILATKTQFNLIYIYFNPPKKKNTKRRIRRKKCNLTLKRAQQSVYVTTLFKGSNISISKLKKVSIIFLSLNFGPMNYFLVWILVQWFMVQSQTDRQKVMHKSPPCISTRVCYCGCGRALTLPRSAGAPAGIVPGGSAMRRLMISSIFVAVSFKVSVSSVVMSASVILLVSFWCKVWLSLTGWILAVNFWGWKRLFLTILGQFWVLIKGIPPYIGGRWWIDILAPMSMTLKNWVKVLLLF